jgi:adenylate cyclase class 2
MPAGLETEIKLRFDSPAAARAAVRAIGAQPSTPRRLQADALFDTEQRHLSAQQQVLRVRTEDGRCCVTFKSPAYHPTLKVREELETAVGDGQVLYDILERAGFRVWFRYEKYREEFRLGDVVIALDETPVGTFVELEGTDKGIGAAAAALGRGPGDYVVDSYRTLFVQHCQARGLAATHMTFDALGVSPLD